MFGLGAWDYSSCHIHTDRKRTDNQVGLLIFFFKCRIVQKLLVFISNWNLKFEIWWFPTDINVLSVATRCFLPGQQHEPQKFLTCSTIRERNGGCDIQWANGIHCSFPWRYFTFWWICLGMAPSQIKEHPTCYLAHGQTCLASATVGFCVCVPGIGYCSCHKNCDLATHPTDGIAWLKSGHI